MLFTLYVGVGINKCDIKEWVYRQKNELAFQKTKNMNNGSVTSGGSDLKPKKADCFSWNTTCDLKSLLWITQSLFTHCFSYRFADILLNRPWLFLKNNSIEFEKSIQHSIVSIYTKIIYEVFKMLKLEKNKELCIHFSF